MAMRMTRSLRWFGVFVLHRSSVTPLLFPNIHEKNPFVAWCLDTRPRRGDLHAAIPKSPLAKLPAFKTIPTLEIGPRKPHSRYCRQPASGIQHTSSLRPCMAMLGNRPATVHYMGARLPNFCGGEGHGEPQRERRVKGRCLGVRA